MPMTDLALFAITIAFTCYLVFFPPFSLGPVIFGCMVTISLLFKIVYKVVTARDKNK
jgi:hypothetical protein